MKLTVMFAIVLVLFSTDMSAQSDLKTLVETERAFARTASEKDTKSAFLEFLADDGIVFSPAAQNGKAYWKTRPESSSLLSWTPEFADISSNGVIGYTTGPWEFRPKGKDDAATAFGHYVTIWQKHPDGKFKAVLDIGINHPQVALVSEWSSPAGTGRELNEKRSSAADTSAQFFETAERVSIERAYKTFFAEDGRLYRNDKVPFVGKKNALSELKSSKNKIRFAKRSLFLSAADLAYITNTYTLYDSDLSEIEKGNFLQIWKLRKGRWQIVLDLFNPLPGK